MIHRIKKENDMPHGKWNGLGGKLEPGETPEECAIREIHEESGLHVSDLVFKGLITFPGFANDEDWYTYIFTADHVHGDLIDSPEGVLQWIDNDKLLDLNLWPGDKIFIPWLQHPGFFSAKFIYKNKTLVDNHVNFYHENHS